MNRSPFTRLNVVRSTSSLWRVTFDNPPINLIDWTMIVELHRLLTEIEEDRHVAVVVFDSTNPDFLLLPGELLEAVRGQLRVVAYEDIVREEPRPAALQRICAIRTAEG